MPYGKLAIALLLAAWWGPRTVPAGTGATIQEYPVRPYVDPAQMDVPWPKHSHVKQPWRAYLETKSGADFLRGIGINYNVPGNDAVALPLLAQAGFRTLRIEIGWGNVRWDETGLTDDRRIRQQLQLCRQYGVRPLILLNAHHGAPCPLRTFRKTLAADAPKGSRTVRFTDTNDIVRGTGISGLTGYWAAEALITNVVPPTGECQLSKPLPKDLTAGSTVELATLKYLPLYPIGTSEFNATADGWVRYALLICRLVHDAGIEAFDLEIWNELGFGARFLSINNYYQPAVATFSKDYLSPGGQAWELARRTVEAVKRSNPGVRCIWGFSNTTFFHTGVDRLPPMIDGQSYHPYGTGTRKLPQQEYHRDHPEENVDGFTPTIDIRMSEGWAQEFFQTESLIRLINPTARQLHPPGTTRFAHFMTEHGVAPPDAGVKDEAKAWELKAKCALRSFCLWLNKGVEAMHYFCAYDRAATGMGVLPITITQASADASFDQVATLPLRAVRNLTSAFAGSVPLESTQPLDVEVVGLGEPQKMFDGDATHPPLWHRDCFAFLPFQVNKNRFVIALYVMTYDATQPMPEERYRLTIKGFAAPPKDAELFDPLQGRPIPTSIARKGADWVELEVPAVDYPRLLTVTM
jgi:hypothetical protein